MTEKKDTWDNLLDFESEYGNSKTIKDDKSDALPHGHVTTIGNSGKRFLIVDDSSAVISNHIANFQLQIELEESTNQDFTIALWHAHQSQEGDFAALIEWLGKQDKFDGLFLDADLKMDTETGFDLANQIHKTESLRYQPLCILTAQYTNQKQKAVDNPHIKLLIKFEKHQDHAHVLTQMFAALPELQDAMRRKFWADCHDQMVRALEKRNATAKSVAYSLGNYLSKFHFVNGWYLRERRGGLLRAIDMDDQYDGQNCLQLSNLPGFLQGLLSNRSTDVSVPRARHLIVKDLPLEECGAFEVLQGKQCLAIVMRADNDDLTGLFSVYRDADAPDFIEDDARQLQQLVIHIQTLMLSEAKQKFQNDLLAAIDDAREAETVEQMAEDVLPFLHQTINPRRYDDEFCKSSFRVYDAGTGNLKRVGDLLGNSTELEGDIGNTINVMNDDSTIAKAVRERRSVCFGNVNVQLGTSLKTAKQEMPSCLAVPLSYDGAVLGALNFESSVLSKFDEEAESIANQFASLLASILFRRRGENFLSKFSQLSADLIAGNHSKLFDAKRVEQTCMSMLYNFCRFSNALFIEIDDLSNIDEIDLWRIRSWSSERLDGASASFGDPDPQERTESWKEAIKQAGDRSFLVQSLKSRDGENTYFTDNVEAIPQFELEVGLRPEGQSTLSQMVIKVFTHRGTLSALCLLFESPAPFTRGYRAIVARFAEFISYLNSSGVATSSNPYGPLQEYEKQLFSMYVTLMHSQKKVIRGIVAELEAIRDNDNDFERGLERVKKKANLIRLNSEVLKSILSTQEDQTSFRLDDLWDELVESYQVFLDDLSATLEPFKGDLKFTCARSRLKTILSILIGNSIEHGGHDFEISLTSTNDGKILYRDTGVGIPLNTRSMIFDHYSAASSGTGTGLIIAQLLAEKANLSISLLEPQPSTGVSFVIEFKGKKT